MNDFVRTSHLKLARQKRSPQIHPPTTPDSDSTSASKSSTTPVAAPTGHVTKSTAPAHSAVSSVTKSSASASKSTASTISVSSIVSTSPSSSAAHPSTLTATTIVAGQASSSSVVSSSSSSLLPSESAADGSSNHISYAGIGVVGAIMAVAILGAIAFIMRKRMIAKREAARNTWRASLYPALDAKRGEIGDDYYNPSEKTLPALENGDVSTQIQKPLPPPGHRPPSFAGSFDSQIPSIELPPAVVNSPTVAPTIAANGGLSPHGRVESAIVRRAFLPSLPDELHIQPGETIQILAAYDDGWCLCVGSMGDRGVVPVECLARGIHSNTTSMHDSLFDSQSSVGRMSKRASSLFAGGVPHGSY